MNGDLPERFWSRMLMIDRSLKAIAYILIATITAQSAPPTEGVIAKLIVGKWFQEEAVNGVTIKSTTTYHKDGVLSGEAVLTKGGRSLYISIKGTWRVEGSKLIEVVEKVTPPQA